MKAMLVGNRYREVLRGWLKPGPAAYSFYDLWCLGPKERVNLIL
jgi:hypothetical protein